MSTPPRVPPRFVPTLTDVVHLPEAATLSEVPIVVPPAPAIPPRPPQPAAEPAQPVLASVQTAMMELLAQPTSASPLPPGIEEYIVHRVMQRVDVVLDRRLSEAVALVVQEQTRSLVPRLREEVESVVRHAVYEAVAEELANGSPSK